MKTKIKKIQSLGLFFLFKYVLIKLYQGIRIFCYKKLFSLNVPIVNNSKLNQPASFYGKGKIKLNGVEMGVMTSNGFLSGVSYLEARGPEAKIEILEGTFINNSATIIADRSYIRVGKNCLIGTNFTAYDSDFHGMELEDRFTARYEVKPVVIEDDVFIGSNVTILKGVTIGRGAVIGANSVVTKNVGNFEVWAGFPAKFIKTLSREK